MLVEQAQGKAIRTSLHRLTEQCGHAIKFRWCGLPFGGSITHHVVTEAGERHQKASVKSNPALLYCLYILRKAFPLFPRNTIKQNVLRHCFDVDQIPRNNVLLLWPTWRYANTTVPHQHTGHTVPG